MRTYIDLTIENVGPDAEDWEPGVWDIPGARLVRIYIANSDGPFESSPFQVLSERDSTNDFVCAHRILYPGQRIRLLAFVDRTVDRNGFEPILIERPITKYVRIKVVFEDKAAALALGWRGEPDLRAGTEDGKPVWITEKKGMLYDFNAVLSWELGS